MAYGTPAHRDDIEAFYTHIRRGRPPSAEQLATLVDRYDAMGGTSRMAARTAAQVGAIAKALEARAPGTYEVVLGQKHAAPFVEDAAAALAAAGIDRVVGLVLSPYFAGASVGAYQARLATVVRASDGTHVAIERWGDEAAWLDFTAAAVTDALGSMPARTKLLFTAHSLPERVLVDDPYPAELEAGARAVVDRLAAPRPDWATAWQSAGATPEPWRGPDVRDVIRELEAADSHDGVLVCPHGFVTDHLEVAYDLDVDAASVAAEVGLEFARTHTLDDDPTVMAALADRIIAAARA